MKAPSRKLVSIASCVLWLLACGGEPAAPAPEPAAAKPEPAAAAEPKAAQPAIAPEPAAPEPEAQAAATPESANAPTAADKAEPEATPQPAKPAPQSAAAKPAAKPKSPSQEPPTPSPEPPSPPAPEPAQPADPPAAAAAPPPKEPAPTRVSVPQTDHVRVSVPSGLQALLDKDPRMQPWLARVIPVIDRCYAQERARSPEARGVVQLAITMHERARPDADVSSVPAELGGVVACATPELMRARPPLFTGPEGDRYTVRIEFQP